MTDAHCHLNDGKFSNEEIDSVLQRSINEGVVRMICNGAGVASSISALTIARRFLNVYATVGIHPEESEEVVKYGEDEIKKKLLELCDDPKVVAIGEAGLDYQNPSPDDILWQRKIFKINLWLCNKTGLPLVVHNRNADEDIREILKGHKTGVQLHCFVQGKEMLDWAITKKYFVSFGGVLTFKKSTYLRELARECPRQSVLIETDSPYLAPEPKRGTRNEPVNVKIVAQTLASTWGVSVEQVDIITSENVASLFTKIR
jgi:TatD DNase family protein